MQTQDTGEGRSSSPDASAGMRAQAAAWLAKAPAAFIVALISMSYAISYGAMIFGGGDAGLLQTGLPLLFLSTCVLLVMQACSSTLPFVVAGVDSNCTGILALMVSGIWTALAGQGEAESAAVTALAAVAVSTLVVGLTMAALGWTRRGNLVQFVPFPVLGGFLAGTGYLLWIGAFNILVGRIGEGGLAAALGHLHWVTAGAALIVALAMLGLPGGRRLTHPFTLPAALGVATLFFYGGMWVSGHSIEQARAAGWLFAPMASSGFHAPSLLSWQLIDWPMLLEHYGEFFALSAVMTLTVLLNATGIGLATQRDVDFNQELRSAGVANIVAGLLGGATGCQSLSRSLLSYQLGARDRKVAVLAAVICLACALFFLPLVAYLPRPVLAGLLVGLGGSLLNEWLLKSRRRLGRSDYVLILLILVVIALYGFVTGVGVGIVVACVLFVVDYSRVSCVKMEFTAAALHSKLERTMEANAALRQLGDRVFGLSLQGFLFFGSANQMVNRVRQQLLQPREFVVIDFRHVQGLDGSTTQSFTKLAQVCAQHRATLILTGLTDGLRKPVERAFAGQQAPMELADLDAALEWVEDRLLAASTVQRDGDLEISLATYFDTRELQALFARTERVELEAGVMLFRKGDIGDCMYFIDEGQVSISLATAAGRVRLRTFSNATIVGEMALYSGQKRTADVVTDRPTRAYKLSMSRLRILEKEDPATALQLHNYVVRVLASRLAATNEAYRLTQ